MIAIRRHLRKKFGMLHRVELHGTELIRPRAPEYKLLGPRRTRIRIYSETMRLVVANMPDAVIINVNFNKENPKHSSSQNTNDIQYLAWERLIQRFNTYLLKSCHGGLGLIFADQTNEVKIRGLLRKMRVFNPMPSHYGGTYPATVDQIVEDPVMRNSSSSYFIQIADLICHSLYRKLYPRGSQRKFNIDKLFDLMDSLCLKEASKSDPQGIVHL